MAEGWTQAFSPVPNLLGCPFPGILNRPRKQQPPALTPRDRQEGLCPSESLNFLFSESPHHPPEQEGEEVSFFCQTSSVPLSDSRGLTREDVGFFPLPGKKLEKDTTWLPSSTPPPPTRALLYPGLPPSRSRNKYLFGASTQPLLCLLRVGWGQCLGPQSSPQ